jgi:hypothetical protein
MLLHLLKVLKWESIEVRNSHSFHEVLPLKVSKSAHYNFKCTVLKSSIILFFLPVNDALITPKIYFREDTISSHTRFGAMVKIFC